MFKKNNLIPQKVVKEFRNFETGSVKIGDEIIMPTFTIISCVSGLIKKGCIPVFVDQEPDTWNMNVDQIESKITSRTKAIMVVHIYGLPVEMNKVLEIATKYNLKSSTLV